MTLLQSLQGKRSAQISPQQNTELHMTIDPDGCLEGGRRIGKYGR